MKILAGKVGVFVTKFLHLTDLLGAAPESIHGVSVSEQEEQNNYNISKEKILAYKTHRKWKV
jgi:hypothetical protein